MIRQFPQVLFAEHSVCLINLEISDIVMWNHSSAEEKKQKFKVFYNMFYNKWFLGLFQFYLLFLSKEKYESNTNVMLKISIVPRETNHRITNIRGSNIFIDPKTSDQLSNNRFNVFHISDIYKCF